VRFKSLLLLLISEKEGGVGGGSLRYEGWGVEEESYSGREGGGGVGA
jgi:hypothetical protein